MTVKDISWKQVVVIVAFLFTLAILTYAGSPTGAFIAIGVAILGGLGLITAQVAQTKEQTTAVKEQTNGNTTKMLEMLERMANQMATMHPVPPPVETDSAEWSSPKERE